MSKNAMHEEDAAYNVDFAGSGRCWQQRAAMATASFCNTQQRV